MATGRKIEKLVRADYEDYDIILIRISDIQSIYTEATNNDYYVLIQQSSKGDNHSIFHSFPFGNRDRYNLFSFMTYICNKINEAKKKTGDDFLLILKHRDNPKSYKDVYLLSEVMLVP
jgi:hypothetical protein